MAISLSKGGRISLSKEAPDLKKIHVGLGWDPRATDGADFDLLVPQFVHRQQHVLGIAAPVHGVDIHDEVFLDIRALGNLRSAPEVLRVEVLAVLPLRVAWLGPEPLGVGHAAHAGVAESGRDSLGDGNPPLVVEPPNFGVQGRHHFQVRVRIDLPDEFHLIGNGLADDPRLLFVGSTVGQGRLGVFPIGPAAQVQLPNHLG